MTDDTALAEARVRIAKRFPTAATGGPPTYEQRNAVVALQKQVIELGVLIEASVPDGRNKSLALTHLEDALMRANRGIFQETE